MTIDEQPPTLETPEVAGVVTITDPAEERAQAVAGTDRQIKTIQDWMNAEENRPETDEQRKKRERREKSKKIIAAVSDGISALSNLYFTSQYAPNMYNPKTSTAGVVDERIERAKAEREKKRDQYMNFAFKLGDVENERARTLRDLEAKQEARKLAREKSERDAEQHRWLALLQDDKQREQKGKADKAEQDAITAQVQAENAPVLQTAKLDTEKARAGAQRASAANSYAAARAHDRSEANEFTAWDEHGKPHTFRTKAAADAFAKQHGTWKETEQSETTHTTGKRASGLNIDQTVTKTKKGGHPGKPSPTGRQSPTA